MLRPILEGFPFRSPQEHRAVSAVDGCDLIRLSLVRVRCRRRQRDSWSRDWPRCGHGL